MENKNKNKDKEVINVFKLRIKNAGGEWVWYYSTLYSDGTVERKEIKDNV